MRIQDIKKGDELIAGYLAGKIIVEVLETPAKDAVVFHGEVVSSSNPLYDVGDRSKIFLPERFSKHEIKNEIIPNNKEPMTEKQKDYERMGGCLGVIAISIALAVYLIFFL